MFCSSCGTQNEEGTKFCSNCGAPLPVAVDPTTGDVVADPSTAGATAANPEKGLGWAKFLGYFALWAGALINFAGAFQSLTGSKYGKDADLVYSVFKALKPLDVFYGLLCIAIVVVQVMAAISIIKRKKATIVLVPAIYCIVFLVVLAYSLLATAVIKQSAFEASVISNLAVNAVMFFANITYFKNRSDVFCN